MFNNFPTLRTELHKYVPTKFDDYKMRYTTYTGSPGYFIPKFDTYGSFEDAKLESDRLKIHHTTNHRRKKIIIEENDKRNNDEKNKTYADMIETYVINPQRQYIEKEMNGKEMNGKSINGKEINGKEMNRKSIIKEHYDKDDSDYTYLQILQERAMCVCRYLLNNRYYHKYIENWKLLASNLNKNKLTFQRLQDSDEDVAYVVNKGEEVNFRFRDKIRYVPLNIYQYVLYHEMAHMSTHELQHTNNFYMLMSIIVLAGFELGFIDLRRIPIDIYKSNNQEILDKQTIKEEIITGTYNIETSESKHHFEGLRNYIERIA